MQDDSTPSAARSNSRGGATGTVHRSFPLLVLLQLATCWAALIACVDGPALGQHIDMERWSGAAWAAIVGAILVGAVLGLIAGLSHIGKKRGAITGLVLGAVAGLTILCVYMAPAPIERIVAAAALVVLSTVIVRVRAA